MLIRGLNSDLSSSVPAVTSVLALPLPYQWSSTLGTEAPMEWLAALTSWFRVGPHWACHRDATGREGHDRSKCRARMTLTCCAVA